EPSGRTRINAHELGLGHWIAEDHVLQVAPASVDHELSLDRAIAYQQELHCFVSEELRGIEDTVESVGRTVSPCVHEYGSSRRGLSCGFDRHDRVDIHAVRNVGAFIGRDPSLRKVVANSLREHDDALRTPVQILRNVLEISICRTSSSADSHKALGPKITHLQDE